MSLHCDSMRQQSGSPNRLLEDWVLNKNLQIGIGTGPVRPSSKRGIAEPQNILRRQNHQPPSMKSGAPSCKLLKCTISMVASLASLGIRLIPLNMLRLPVPTSEI